MGGTITFERLTRAIPSSSGPLCPSALRELLRKGGNCAAINPVMTHISLRCASSRGYARYSRIYDAHDKFVQRNGIIPYCRRTNSTAARFSSTAPALFTAYTRRACSCNRYRVNRDSRTPISAHPPLAVRRDRIMKYIAGRM